MEKIRSLVKNAVGFDEQRGDSLTVTSAAFHVEKVEPLPEIPIWEQSWFAPLAKQVFAGLVVLSLIFFVLKPMVGGLMPQVAVAGADGGSGIAGSGGAAGAAGVAGATGEDGVDGESTVDEILDGEGPLGYEERLKAAQKMINDEPDLSSLVLKNWSAVAEEREV